MVIEASRLSIRQIYLAIGIVVAVFIWSYWLTIIELIDTWNNEPDYSHGYLVVPLALVFLWVRRDLCPDATGKVAWLGLILILISAAIRYAGVQQDLLSLVGWSMMLWIAGVVWLLGGRRVFWWSLPSIVFLAFMVPLPGHCERLLSVPLQRMATKGGCWLLQFLGEPALASGNTIFIGDRSFGAAGLQVFMGVLAVAFAFVVLCRRTWWERAFLLLIALPIAVIANATRIAVTGLLMQHANGAAQDAWPTIALAAALYALVLSCLEFVRRGQVTQTEHSRPDEVVEHEDSISSSPPDLSSTRPGDLPAAEVTEQVSRHRLMLLVVLTLVTLVGPGGMARYRSATFKPEHSLAEAVRQLGHIDRLPSQSGNGDWQLLSAGDLDEGSLELLQPDEYFIGVFKRESEVPVVITILVGPPGTTNSVTPEVGLGGWGYRPLQEQTREVFLRPDGSSDQFWAIAFQSRGYDRHVLKEYWAWNANDRWEAPESSRRAFSSSDRICKLQVACRLPAGTDPTDTDPCRDFLEDFLPFLRRLSNGEAEDIHASASSQKENQKL